VSLTQRKARPLERNAGSFRDDRLFIVACDDSYAPRQYFDFFKMPRIQVHVEPTPNDENTCHAKDVLTRLKNIDYKEYDERWMLLDIDHYTQGSHIKSFQSAIKLDEQNENLIPVKNTSRVYQLWLAIVKNASPSQLPHELTKLFK